jgi:hypothetical protein
LGDVLFLLREFVQYGDKELPASSVMVAAAKALLAKIEGPPRLGLTYEHTFTVKIQSKKPRKAVESRLFALLDSEFVNYWIGHEVEPVASSQPAPAASSPPPAPAPPPPPSPLDFVLHQFRDLSQAMLGMCDCDKPDEKALGDALREWICMRDQLDIYLLPNKTPIPLAGRDLDSSCGD